MRYGIKAINRALAGVTGPTVVHVCFGYAAVVSEKPSGYTFLAELGGTVADQISIEAAQPRLDLDHGPRGVDHGVLRDLAGKTIMLGVLDLNDQLIEAAEAVAARIRNGLRFVAADKLVPAPDCGMKYLTRDIAFGKLKSLADGARIVRQELTG